MSDSNKKTEDLESDGKQPVSITNINITDSVVNRSEIGKKINTNSSASGKGKSNIVKQISRKLA